MRRPRSAGDAVELIVRDGVAWMTLARPATGNRLDAELLGALGDACAVVEDDERARVAVLGARGRLFSAGLPDDCAWPEPGWPDGVGAVAALTKPVLAAIGGHALGWGFALALACDVRIAATTAVFTLPDAAAGRSSSCFSGRRCGPGVRSRGASSPPRWSLRVLPPSSRSPPGRSPPGRRWRSGWARRPSSGRLIFRSRKASGWNRTCTCYCRPRRTVARASRPSGRAASHGFGAVRRAARAWRIRSERSTFARSAARR